MAAKINNVITVILIKYFVIPRHFIDYINGITGKNKSELFIQIV
jgi:antibiotic biosynthesis monooxygenase (ABM) superfamily enzyme